MIGRAVLLGICVGCAALVAGAALTLRPLAHSARLDAQHADLVLAAGLAPGDAVGVSFEPLPLDTPLGVRTAYRLRGAAHGATVVLPLELPARRASGWLGLAADRRTVTGVVLRAPGRYPGAPDAELSPSWLVALAGRQLGDVYRARDSRGAWREGLRPPLLTQLPSGHEAVARAGGDIPAGLAGEAGALTPRAVTATLASALGPDQFGPWIAAQRGP